MAQLIRPTRGPEVLAKDDGPCKGCDKPIVAGDDYICVVDPAGTMHAKCAIGYCRVFEEHEEKGGEGE